MKLITRNTDYAIRALVYILKSKKDVVSVSELVKNLNMPRPFIRKILQHLQSENILKSVKGQGGGFLVDDSIKEMNLADMIQIFQGKIQLSHCFFRKKICPNKKSCRLRKEINNIEQLIVKKFEKIKLASLL